MEAFVGNILGKLATGRLRAWIVLIIGIVVVGALVASSTGASTDVVIQDLTPTAESAKQAKAADKVSKTNVAPAVVVFTGSTADMAAANAELTQLSTELIAKYGTAAPDTAGGPPAAAGAPSGAGAPAGAGPPVLVPSEDGKAALVFIPMRTDVDNTKRVKSLRTSLDTLPTGVSAKVTGGPAFATDVAAAFDGANVSLLIGTTLLVFVLLVIIYRSPIFWIVPLSVVVLAEAATRGLEPILTSLGFHVDPATSGITSVLVFGAGTDYALLLVARYREELRHNENRFVAMRRALTTAGPAVFASGISVALCLILLTLADTPSLQQLGVLSSLGVLLAMTAMLTLLPALLLIVGRGIFWPFVPRYDATAVAAPGTTGFWRGVGDRVVRRPRTIWIVTSVLLGAAALGVTQLPTSLSPNDQFQTKVEAVEGQRALAQHFPGGSSSTTNVFLPDADAQQAAADAAAIAKASKLVAKADVSATGDAGSVVELTLTLDPYSEQAIDAVPDVRDTVRGVNSKALVGGATAEEYDKRTAAQRDVKVIVPVVLVVEFVLLALLLHALVAPLMLIISVVLSYGAALGLGALAFEHLFSYAGADPTLPLLAFVFLTALGVDYNIFLMTRVREESSEHATREGMLRALGVTGSVITSAGIVLAGTFAILATLPIVQLGQLGLIIAVGVFIDTFIVRSLLVPAAVFDADWRTWMPSALARRLGAEHAASGTDS